jgi:hypothetical protein
MSEHFAPLLAGTHAPLSDSTTTEQKRNAEDNNWSEVKLYNATLSLAQIEANVPPNVLLQFISSYLVQTPTVLQILKYYNEKLWGQDKLKTSRVMCSLAVNLQPIAAKRAAVKWAERQLQQVSSATDSSEYKRLVHGWHLALHKAEMGEVAHTRRLKIEKNEQRAKKTKNAKLTENEFEKGRQFQQKRFDQVMAYHDKYKDIGREHGKIRKMQEVLDSGKLRANAKSKMKRLAFRAGNMSLFGVNVPAVAEDTQKKLRELRTVLKVRDKLKGSMVLSAKNRSLDADSFPSTTGSDAPALVPARPEQNTSIGREASVNMKLRGLQMPK